MPGRDVAYFNGGRMMQVCAPNGDKRFHCMKYNGTNGLDIVDFIDLNKANDLYVNSNGLLRQDDFIVDKDSWFVKVQEQEGHCTVPWYMIFSECQFKSLFELIY